MSSSTPGPEIRISERRIQEWKWVVFKLSKCFQCGIKIARCGNYRKIKG